MQRDPLGDVQAAPSDEEGERGEEPLVSVHHDPPVRN
jgi:hypothetical protein